jgi:hypothetical protein
MSPSSSVDSAPRRHAGPIWPSSDGQSDSDARGVHGSGRRRHVVAGCGTCAGCGQQTSVTAGTVFQDTLDPVADVVAGAANNRCPDTAIGIE